MNLDDTTAADNAVSFDGFPATVLSATATSLTVNPAFDVDEASFAEALYTQGLPDPDLLIRTSGEQRISNFLLYQTAYSEFYVSPVLWPDFKKEHLYEAIYAFQNRERRFGGTEKVPART